MEALNAADMASQGLNAGLGKSGILTGAFAHKAATDVDYNLIGITATFTHSTNKSHMTSTTVTDTGSTIKAGERVSVNAVKDINATGQQYQRERRDIQCGPGYQPGCGIQNQSKQDDHFRQQGGHRGECQCGSARVRVWSER